MPEGSSYEDNEHYSFGVVGATLSVSARSRANRKTGDNVDAINVLHDFENEVHALVNSGRVTDAAAAPLLLAADSIITMISD